MVEDRITDGKRIGQLLASELTGLSAGPLDRLDVVDADRDAEPSADGTFAYGIALDGDRVGEVSIHETAARLDLRRVAGASPARLEQRDDADGLDVSTTSDGVRIVVERGAAVKRAVDVVGAVLADR